MFESMQQTGGGVPAADVRQAIRRQREMLTDLLTVSMFKAARRLAPLIDIRHALELLLIDEIEHMRYCRRLYVLDVNGSQVTGSIGRNGVDRSQYACNRAGRAYLQNIIGVSDFRLSEIYLSGNGRRPSISAIQVMRDRSLQRVGYLGAEFDLCELPHTRDLCRDLLLWCRSGSATAPRAAARRCDGAMDRRLGAVLKQLHELIVERGVFHGTLDFTGDCVTLWSADDPFRYRLLGIDQLLGADVRLACPRRPYPDTALVPADLVPCVLERFRALRTAYAHSYLHAGSLNIFNGTVILHDSRTGSRYLNFREFLEQDAQPRSGLRCAV